MLKESSYSEVYIACGYTDLRKGIDGLAAWIQQQFDLNPHRTGAIFLFCGRKNDRIKALVWEGDGFLLLYKRAAEGRFNWPRKSSDLRDLTPEQLTRLLDGFAIDPGIKQIPAPEYAL